MSRFQLDNPFLYNIGIRQAVFWETDTKSGGGGSDDNDNDNDSDANNPNADAATTNTSGSTFDMNDPSTWTSTEADNASTGSSGFTSLDAMAANASNSSGNGQQNNPNDMSNDGDGQQNNPNNSPAGSPMATTITTSGGSASSMGDGQAQDNNPNAPDSNPVNNNAVGFTEAPGSGFGTSVVYPDTPPPGTGGGGSGSQAQDNNPNAPMSDLIQDNTNNTTALTEAPMLGGSDTSSTNVGMTGTEGSDNTSPNSPYNENGTYARDGLIYIGDPSNGKLANGNVDGVTYVDGVPVISQTTPPDNNSNSSIDNLTMTGEDNDVASPYFDETAEGDGLLKNGDGTLYTGTFGGETYINGVKQGGGDSSELSTPPTPYMEGDILMGADGTPYTGSYNGTEYVDGVPVNTSTTTETETSSAYDPNGTYARNGLIYIGDPNNGVLANGMVNGINYSNGRVVGGNFGEGDDDGDGDNVINTGSFTYDDNGNLLQDGNPFTGEYNGENYVDGVLQTGDGDSVTAGGQTLTVTFPDGSVVTGTVDADGNVTDENGNVIGTWDGTTFTRSDGTTTTATLQNVSITMNDGTTLSGFLDGDGNVVDANGNILGTINDQGQFVRSGTSVTEGGDGVVDGGSTGSVDTGYSISGGIIYDSNGNIIGYEDGYKDDTETLAENLESATGTSTTGMSRSEIIAMIEEYMSSYNNANYDPAAFMNAFGFALDPNFAGGVIPSFFEGSKAGVYMRRLVKDRDTGELRYIDVPIGGAFGSGLNARMQRRQGFGQALQF